MCTGLDDTYVVLCSRVQRVSLSRNGVPKNLPSLISGIRIHVIHIFDFQNIFDELRIEWIELVKRIGNLVDLLPRQRFNRVRAVLQFVRATFTGDISTSFATDDAQGVRVAKKVAPPASVTFRSSIASR